MAKKVRSKVIFVIFLLSAAAMDGGQPVISGMICAVSLLLLTAENRKPYKKKEPAATDSNLKRIVNPTLIIALGKGKSNGKM